MKKTISEKASVKSKKADAPLESQFAEVAELVQAGRQIAFASVNAALIETYWEVGRYISLKVEKEAWGQGVVKKLADYLQNSIPNPCGFSSRNLWRMKQFHDFYRGYKKVSTVLTQLPWSSHLILLSKTKSIKECEFYLNLAIGQKFDVRALGRAIDSEMYSRIKVSKPKVSTALTQMYPLVEAAVAVARIVGRCGYRGIPPDRFGWNYAPRQKRAMASVSCGI